MKLFEFEAKDVLRKHGISIPLGRTARTAEEATTIAAEIGGPVAVKAQVLVSGRGKAGGILFADRPEEAGDRARHLLGSRVKGGPVDTVLVEEKLDIADQLYASVAIDPQARSYVALASTAGGVDIEDVAASGPDRIVRSWFGPSTRMEDRDGLDIMSRLHIGGNKAMIFSSVIRILCEVALQNDAELVEINPVAVTPSGEFIAADARLIVDDNSLFRHPEFQGRASERVDDTALEAQARKQGLVYVDLSGDIGIIGNGAGLVMATLDLVDLFGGKPANFLDIGGGARPDIVKKSLLMVMSKPDVRAILINILGGITRCDLVAQGVIEALREASVRKPVAIRMIGTNEEQGTRMLREAGVYVYSDMEEAVKKALEAK